MVETIFSHPFFMQGVLPFLLVFTLVFAVLDKSKLLGEGKRQINAIISLVIGLIVIGFAYPTGIIVKLVPFFAVALFVLFIFMLIYGFISGKKEGDMLNKGLKIALGIIFGLAVVVAVLWATGIWQNVIDLFINSSYGSKILLNAVVIAIIIAAIVAVLVPGGKSSS